MKKIINSNNMIWEFCDTEGENIIEFFLESEWIKYKKQVEIPKLKGDYADYRIADFYIPKYKVYLEFFGKYRNYEINQKYKFKKDLYKENNIPCIYIYPDNLGTLQFTFYMRLRKVLEKEPNLWFQLIRYKLTLCRQVITLIWVTTFLFIFFVGFNSKIAHLKIQLTPNESWLILLVLLFSIIMTIFSVRKIFFKKYVNLNQE